MSKYEVIERDLGVLGISESILRKNEDGTITSIPTDPANSDYQAYLRWLEDPTTEESGTLK